MHNSPRNNIRGYVDLSSKKDWNMLPMLKLFQKADLYSKKDELNEEFDYELFDNLIDKYIGEFIQM